MQPPARSLPLNTPSSGIRWLCWHERGGCKLLRLERRHESRHGGSGEQQRGAGCHTRTHTAQECFNDATIRALLVLGHGALARPSTARALARTWAPFKICEQLAGCLTRGILLFVANLMKCSSTTSSRWFLTRFASCDLAFFDWTSGWFGMNVRESQVSLTLPRSRTPSSAAVSGMQPRPNFFPG